MVNHPPLCHSEEQRSDSSKRAGGTNHSPDRVEATFNCCLTVLICALVVGCSPGRPLAASGTLVANGVEVKTDNVNLTSATSVSEAFLAAVLAGDLPVAKRYYAPDHQPGSWRDVFANFYYEDREGTVIMPDLSPCRGVAYTSVERPQRGYQEVKVIFTSPCIRDRIEMTSLPTTAARKTPTLTPEALNSMDANQRQAIQDEAIREESRNALREAEERFVRSGEQNKRAARSVEGAVGLLVGLEFANQRWYVIGAAPFK